MRSSKRGRAVLDQLFMEPDSFGAPQQATTAPILGRRPDQGWAEVCPVCLADRLGHGDDRYALIGGEVLRPEIFAMKDVEGRDLPPRTVRSRDRDVIFAGLTSPSS